MAGRLPASPQEREVSVVTRGVVPSAMPLIALPDAASCAWQVRDPLPRNPTVKLPYTLLKWGLARALFSTAGFLSYAAKHGKSPPMALEDAVGSPVNIMSLVCSCFLGVSG